MQKSKSMHFEKGNLYHIYNQGNNRQKTFFNQENYLFFLRKIKTHIVPYADVLAWCLMPNHFHLMVFVKEIEIPVDSHGVTPLLIAEGTNKKGVVFKQSHPVTRMRSINQSLAILLRSYTRAINKQEQRSGALFREGTKAECLNCFDGITPSFYNTNAGTKIHIDDPEKQYPQICFNYIHKNPVKANLVKYETGWEFSSAKDYAGIRNGKLVNKKRAKEYVNFYHSPDDCLL